MSEDERFKSGNSAVWYLALLALWTLRGMRK